MRIHGRTKCSMNNSPNFTWPPRTAKTRCNETDGQLGNTLRRLTHDHILWSVRGTRAKNATYHVDRYTLTSYSLWQNPPPWTFTLGRKKSRRCLSKVIDWKMIFTWWRDDWKAYLKDVSNLMSERWAFSVLTFYNRNFLLLRYKARNCNWLQFLVLI